MKRQLFLSMFAMLSVATFAQTPATTNINKSGFPKLCQITVLNLP